jgi:hypothetical protein
MPRQHRKHAFWFPLVGLGFAVAGADKLLGQAGYRRLFRQWGWSDDSMRLIGAAEFAGGVLVSSTIARRLGGLLLTTASTAVLTAELERRQDDLAVPRLALLFAAAIASLPPRAG